MTLGTTPTVLMVATPGVGGDLGVGDGVEDGVAIVARLARDELRRRRRVPAGLASAAGFQ